MQKSRGKRSSCNYRNRTSRRKYNPQLATVYEGSNESNSTKSDDYIFAKRNERPTFIKKTISPKTKKDKSKSRQKSFIDKVSAIFSF